ncbi:MAG: response regulator [Synechococcales cyanobacterium RM1_1_8]|nr:response regulator [Synechococcales cyanobacterium RM1_1_8]
MASKKILVIDDSKVIRMRVQDMLPTGNFDILEAKDGVQGLQLIREEMPSLIMLDFLLPKMNGWDVFQHIQGDPSLQSIPLVIMSGRKEEVTEKLPEPFEYFEFIEKPFEKAELMEAIKAAMMKARNRPHISASPTGASAGAAPAEIEALNTRIATLEKEVATLKSSSPRWSVSSSRN